jgi:Cu/Ag efflux pump CusA
MSLAIGRGSEANAPLGRAILGGLLAGEVATLFVLPALYSLLVGNSHSGREAAEAQPPMESVPIGD